MPRGMPRSATNDERRSRPLLTVVLSAGLGFLVASAMAWGYAGQDAWQNYGENFQLGYVVGFLDAVSLEKRHDRRAWVPVYSKPDYERWRKLMNDYFADPANAKRPIADGMWAAGKIFQDEMFRALEQRAKTESSAPSPAPSGVAPPSP